MHCQPLRRGARVPAPRSQDEADIDDTTLLRNLQALLPAAGDPAGDPSCGDADAWPEGALAGLPMGEEEVVASLEEDSDPGGEPDASQFLLLQAPRAGRRAYLSIY